MNAILRPLAGRVLSLSISESEESTGRGFPPWQVNRVTLQVVRALFSQGAGILFGHDWREDGVMEAVHAFALRVQPPPPPSPEASEEPSQPLLQNLLPWPDGPHLSQGERQRLAMTLHVAPAGLPSELFTFEEATRHNGPESPRYGYLRARGLTHLRHRLTELSDARCCLGGRKSGSEGRFPGIVEEALLALQSHQPLYLAGLLGGATRQLITALENEPMPDDFCQPTRASHHYLAPPLPEQSSETRADRNVSREAVWEAFRSEGVGALSRVNGLSPDENDRLFHTPVLDEVIRLVLTGLARLNAKQPRVRRVASAPLSDEELKKQFPWWEAKKPQPPAADDEGDLH